MTKMELSQLYYLDKEIKELRRRIKELEALASSSACQITGMPKIQGINDQLAKYATEIADLRHQLELMLEKCVLEQHRLNSFVNSIDDSQMRMIITLRHISKLNWRQVAEAIGGGNTPDSIRMAHDRFLSQE